MSGRLVDFDQTAGDLSLLYLYVLYALLLMLLQLSPRFLVLFSLFALVPVMSCKHW